MGEELRDHDAKLGYVLVSFSVTTLLCVRPDVVPGILAQEGRGVAHR